MSPWQQGEFDTEEIPRKLLEYLNEDFVTEYERGGPQAHRDTRSLLQPLNVTSLSVGVYSEKYTF